MSGVGSLVHELPATPDLLALHRLDPSRYPCLLETTATGPGEQCFDILFAFPRERLVLDNNWRLLTDGGPVTSDDFLGELGRRLQWVTDSAAAMPGLPFVGGWVVYAGYELAQQIEPKLRLTPGPGPVALALRVGIAVIVDRNSAWAAIVAEETEASSVSAILADIAGLARVPPHSRPAKIVNSDVREDDEGEFLAAVHRVQAHISAGDVYQANISRRWLAEIADGAEPWMLYERLRTANPAPFSGILTSGAGHWVLSSSPERLLRIRGRQIETRPIAGTRPRRPGEPDDIRRAELVANPKERAEHVMLIDLERNDLGKVCTAGSVQVAEFMAVETYAHVHHIVSVVTGELRPDLHAADALRAVFPGGTITGCPKPRCMSLIDEIEGRPRGAYTGTLGYISRDGDADFNILIRTMVCHDRSITIHAGSGIVADSIPERELEETRAKAHGMLLSLT